MINPSCFPYSSFVSKFIHQNALAPTVVDKCNRPIFLSQFKHFESPLFSEVVPSDQQLATYLIHWFEYRSLLLDQLSEINEQAEGTQVLLQTCQLWDFKELSWKHLSDPTINRFMSMYFEMSFSYYPEQIGRIHVVNAHWSWIKIWGWIKTSFHESSIRKIVWHKKSSLLEHLLSEMSLESIPPHLGGCLLMTDGDNVVSDFAILIQSK
jgi:hypothetical protein